MSNLAADLELWMTNLPQSLRTTPLVYLAIPGSHDSGTFNISPSSDIAPDAEPILQILSFLGCIVKEILTQWSLTQYYTIRQQLYRGIRYFDFRIATKKSKDLFYFVHGLYSEEVTVELDEIEDFLEQHPKEIVILDCQHFYGLEDYDHKRFMHLLSTLFGEKLLLYSADVDMKNITLDSMAEAQHQVIIIYRENPTTVENPFWPSQTFPNPWGDKIVASNLIDYLTEQLKLRDYSFGYVSQCILTPSASYILRHLCSNLFSKCLLPLEDKKYEWLNKQTPGPGGINIVISDFVDYEDDEFARAVVKLNEKLLDGNQNVA